MQYTYSATVTKVYDGDTITVDIDLGLHTWIKDLKLRLARINTPEVRGIERTAGLVSRDWLRKRILGKKIIVHTKKDKSGKYGRYIAEVFIDGVNINDRIVELGMAEYKEY